METTNETLPVQRAIVNDYQERRQKILGALLTYSPFMDGTSFSNRDRANLCAAAEGKDHRTAFYLDIKSPSTHADTSATLIVSFDEGWDPVLDNEGNVYSEMKLSITVNYPAHGAAPLDIVRDRLAFYEKVVRYAASIEAWKGSGPMHRLIMTAEKHQEELETQRLNTVRENARLLVLSNRSKMRIGQERQVDFFPDDLNYKLFEGIPDGTYEDLQSHRDGKTYTFHKAGTRSAYITRTS